MNSKPRMERYTKKEFDRQFPDDAACLEWLKNRLYPDGIMCKNCEQVTKHHRVVSRPSYSCDHCGNHVHPTADTIFHKSSTSLTTWFYAIYMMASTRCGISAKQIERETGVTYKTAWRMFKQIRSMLADDGPIGGDGRSVEVDEMYHGGRRKGQTGRPMRGDKSAVPVVGMVERKGRAIALAVGDTTAKTLVGSIRQFVLPSTTVFTDEYASYNTVSEGRRYEHRRIRHSEKVYVIGDIHTNTVEGFWSLIKRGIGGVYHSVSAEYLQSYLNEYSFRYNRRFDTQPMFTSFLHQIQKSESDESPSEELAQNQIA